MSLSIPNMRDENGHWFANDIAPDNTNTEHFLVHCHVEDMSKHEYMFNTSKLIELHENTIEHE